MSTNESIVIVGAGVVGLALGWRLAKRGADVQLIERGRAGRGASWAAGGMLAPDVEAGFEEQELYRFSKESLRRWPAFVEELEEDTNASLGFRTEGTIAVADDRDAAEALRRRYDFMAAEGFEVEWLTGGEALQREPFLAPRLAAAVYAGGNYQVDARPLVEALRQAFTSQGGRIHEETTVQRIQPHDRHPSVVTDEGESFEADTVVLAAGAWSRSIEGLDDDMRPPVRPVKGQMLELRMELPFDLQHVVRGPDAYLVPKADGRLLVGATSEEMGFDTSVTAGGLYDLLEGAWETVPGIYDLPVTDMWVGLRPASRDHEPILGPSAAPGVVYATGHYRHGILLAPVTADELTRLVLDGETSDWIAPYSPLRFAGR